MSGSASTVPARREPAQSSTPCLSTTPIACSLVDNQGKHDQTRRPRSGHPRPADSPHHRHREVAWMGDCATHRVSVEGRAAGEPGFALSGASATGTSRLDHRRVGRLGDQPACTILSTDGGGPTTARQGACRLGATLGRDLPRYANRIAATKVLYANYPSDRCALPCA